MEIGTKKAAAMLGVSQGRIIQLIREKALFARREGWFWLIPLSEVERRRRTRRPAGRPRKSGGREENQVPGMPCQ